MTDMTIDPNDLDVPGELTVGGVGLELPRVHSTEGSDGLGVSRLLGSTGMVTLDPGFTNTASCTSDITYIDGGAGILRYRGYPIAELAKSSSFLEVAYLLINGELPDAKTLERFERRIGRHRLEGQPQPQPLGEGQLGGHERAQPGHEGGLTVHDALADVGLQPEGVGEGARGQRGVAQLGQRQLPAGGLAPLWGGSVSECARHDGRGRAWTAPSARDAHPGAPGSARRCGRTG